MDLNFLSFQSMAVVLFLFLEVLSSATCSHHHKQNSSVKMKTKKRLKGLCIGGQWFRVGSFRFWQRRACASRRDSEEMNVDDFPSAEGGPPKGDNYDPTYGYEPYWADGDWVFDKRPDVEEDANEQSMANMCGTKCSKMYSDYGKVCARNKDFEYKTFENYCALKTFDCSGIARWMVLYRGDCIERDLKTYYRWQRVEMRTMLSEYFSKFGNNTRIKTSPTTISYLEFMKQQKELKEEKYQFAYNPSWGLEPYWVDGEHVLSTFKEDLSRNITTTKMPLVCGEECNYLLRRVKHVCAHKSDYNVVNGCVGYYCPGNPGENLDYGFKTFDTYCEFLDAECKNSFNEGRYVLIYIGKCEKTEDIFKPLWESWQPVSRMNKYISEFYSRHPRTASTRAFTLPPTTRPRNEFQG